MLKQATVKRHSSSIATWLGTETSYGTELMEGPRPFGLLLQHVLHDLQDLEEPSLPPLQAGVGRKEHMVPSVLYPSILPPCFVPQGVVSLRESGQKVAGSTRPWMMALRQEGLALGQNRW